MDTPTHLDGFNHGYTLEKYEPELVRELLKTIEPTTEYTEGFISGSKEYEQERIQAQANELADLRRKQNDQELER